jgi:hemerythrin-like domain-containing protein
MKATTLLKKDHDTVRDLFKEYERAGDRAFQTKKKLFERVRTELEIHSAIEEEIFYPAVKGVHSEEAKDTVREAIEEHAIVKQLIEELSELDPEDEQYDAKFKVLRENVEHHADEEEDEMFSQAKKNLSDEALEDLGARMEARKERLKTDTAA